MLTRKRCIKSPRKEGIFIWATDCKRGDKKIILKAKKWVIILSTTGGLWRRAGMAWIDDAI